MLTIFVALSVLNVIIQTIKSLVTVKGGKMTSALVNAAAYFIYTYVIVYTMCDLPLFGKALITALCNLVGVYCVKMLEEKLRKDKLWRFDCTVAARDVAAIVELLNSFNISYTILDTNTEKKLMFIYSPSQKASEAIRDIIRKYDVKYFVNENRC